LGHRCRELIDFHTVTLGEGQAADSLGSRPFGPDFRRGAAQVPSGDVIGCGEDLKVHQAMLRAPARSAAVTLIAMVTRR
jgi:hypothetical protein